MLQNNVIYEWIIAYKEYLCQTGSFLSLSSIFLHKRSFAVEERALCYIYIEPFFLTRCSNIITPERERTLNKWWYSIESIDQQTKRTNWLILMNEFKQESQMCITEQSKASIWAYKLKVFLFFFKWAIVSFDKSLIHHLKSFTALWTVCSETVWTLNRLVPTEVYIWRKMLERFHQKPSFLFDWRKKDVDILNDIGMSKLSELSNVFCFVFSNRTHLWQKNVTTANLLAVCLDYLACKKIQYIKSSIYVLISNKHPESRF